MHSATMSRQSAANKRPVQGAAEMAWAENDAKKPRRMRGCSAQRAVLDNLRDLPAECVHFVRVQGLTMFEKLTEDKKANIQKRGTVKFSGPYYKNLRKLYKQDEDPSRQLPRGQHPSNACLDAYKQAFSSAGNRQPMRDRPPTLLGAFANYITGSAMDAG